MFGWVLSGSCLRSHEENVSHQMSCINANVCESDLHHFWNLENIGIYPEKDNPPKEKVLEPFKDTVEYVNGRYEVTLPWKNEVEKFSLLNNENIARKRLSVLNYKFEKNPDLKAEYDKVLMDYEKGNIIVGVPHSEIESPYPT